MRIFRWIVFAATVCGPAFAQDAASDGKELASGVRNALPSVVSIETVSGGRQGAWTRVGSGFLYGDRFVVTRKSVIDGSDSIVVALTDGRRSPARLLVCDPSTETAVLEHGIPGVTPIRCIEAAEPRDGVPLAVLGNSLGVFPSVTLARFIGRRPDGLMELDGVIPPGNSGSPVLDGAGRFAGVIVGRLQAGAAPPRVTGLALPAGRVLGFLSSLENSRECAGWIGLSVVDLTGRFERTGVKVVMLMPDGPAERAGLSPGDTLVRFQNDPIRGAADLAKRMSGIEAGRKITFTVRDGKKEETKKVTVSRKPRRTP